MPTFRIVLTRQIVFTNQYEVEAADEDEAVEIAEGMADDEEVLDDWEPGPVNNYGAPDVEEIEEEDDDPDYDENGNLRAGCDH